MFLLIKYLLLELCPIPMYIFPPCVPVVTPTCLSLSLLSPLYRPSCEPHVSPFMSPHVPPMLTLYLHYGPQIKYTICFPFVSQLWAPRSLSLVLFLCTPEPPPTPHRRLHTRSHLLSLSPNCPPLTLRPHHHHHHHVSLLCSPCVPPCDLGLMWPCVSV